MATVHNNLSDYDKSNVPDGKNFRIGIVVSEWNSNITDALKNGAVDTLLENSVGEENIVVWNVPGTFELPFACKHMLQTQDVDAVIAIGSVIQGETKHFDFVCSGTAQGIMNLNIHGDVPVIFCVLTDNNMQQGIERSGGIHGNKGTEAAVAAIKMAALSKF
jgi:6,7-dimethyl-8-ribityllumazine synthase|tara:strand:+ start:167 stop:652 length:486 start_codon:yes stop_codon:yes gene_type:complete